MIGTSKIQLKFTDSIPKKLHTRRVKHAFETGTSRFLHPKRFLMKTILKSLGLLCVAMLFVACTQNKTPTPYKITGEFISMHPEVTEEVAAVEETSTDEAEPTETETDSPVEEEVDEPIDLTNAMLTISYETMNSDGEVETVALVEESFNGDFEFESETAKPTEVTISLQVSEDADPMEINTVIGTGRDVHFTLFDHPSPRNDQFILLGTSSQVMNPENMFSISGDLSVFGDEFKNHSTVNLSARVINDNGENKTLRWGPVLVQDNSFHIEGDVAEPLLATLSISNSDSSGSTQVVLEPLADIGITKLGNQTTEFSTTSGDGYHAQLVTSWQHNEAYIELVNAWTVEYELYLNPPEPAETEDEAETVDDANLAQDADDIDEDSEETADTEEETTESVASVEPAEGCEDAEVGKYVEPRPSTPDESGYPEWYNLRMQAIEVRNSTLRAIVEGGEDPTAQHIAMKMRPYTENADELTAWKTLSEKFDAEFVAIHITPQIESIEQRVMLANNDSALVPGQKAPAFTLLNLEGEEVSLYNVLGENDMVLIDFWASWCGPCIADFPDLKKLYSAYTDEDFEIVGVSIDSTEEAWVGGVEDNTLPWMQLGELEGWYGPIGIQYGVGWIPKGYLVDSQGCIYEKDIRPAALKEFLVDRYGMDDSLLEPDVDSDDSPEVSG